ncbi:hypothetical protein MP228_008320 [Amoeboaphelidium protococcarum]|nr:hypothetical protein MP228_008320 [Amoeboaphelidium protococcarum]
MIHNKSIAFKMGRIDLHMNLFKSGRIVGETSLLSLSLIQSNLAYYLILYFIFKLDDLKKNFKSALSSLLPAGFEKPYAESQVADEVVLFADYSNVAINFTSLRLKRPNYQKAPAREPVEQMQLDIL